MLHSASAAVRVGRWLVRIVLGTVTGVPGSAQTRTVRISVGADLAGDLAQVTAQLFDRRFSPARVAVVDQSGLSTRAVRDHRVVMGSGCSSISRSSSFMSTIDRSAVPARFRLASGAAAPRNRRLNPPSRTRRSIASRYKLRSPSLASTAPSSSDARTGSGTRGQGGRGPCHRPGGHRRGTGIDLPFGPLTTVDPRAGYA